MPAVHPRLPSSHCTTLLGGGVHWPVSTGGCRSARIGNRRQPLCSVPIWSRPQPAASASSAVLYATMRSCQNRFCAECIRFCTESVPVRTDSAQNASASVQNASPLKQILHKMRQTFALSLAIARPGHFSDSPPEGQPSTWRHHNVASAKLASAAWLCRSAAHWRWASGLNRAPASSPARPSGWSFPAG